jgi:hypothetical protein
VVDRIGLRAWREHRRQQLGPNARVPPALVHLIARYAQLNKTTSSGVAGTGAGGDLRLDIRPTLSISKLWVC